MSSLFPDSQRDACRLQLTVLGHLSGGTLLGSSSLSPMRLTPPGRGMGMARVCVSRGMSVLLMVKRERERDQKGKRMQGRNGAKPSCARRQKREFGREAVDLRGGVRVQPAQPSLDCLAGHTWRAEMGTEGPHSSGDSPTQASRAPEYGPRRATFKLERSFRTRGWGLGERGATPPACKALPTVSRASSEDKLSDHMLFRDITVGDLWGPAGWSPGGRYRPPILWWSQSLGLWAAPSWRAASVGPVSPLDWEQLPCPGILQDYSGPVVFAPFLY